MVEGDFNTVDVDTEYASQALHWAKINCPGQLITVDYDNESERYVFYFTKPPSRIQTMFALKFGFQQ